MGGGRDLAARGLDDGGRLIERRGLQNLRNDPRSRSNESFHGRPTHADRVPAASAGSCVKGSSEVGVALRLSASIGILSTARWSAMKKAAKHACSSFCADGLVRGQVKFASG